MYCRCGCGGLTKISPSTQTAKGWVKGQPRRFINGHNPNPIKEPKYSVNPVTGCWNWLLATTWDGYGVTYIGSKQVYAHRFYYEKYKGEIPPGHEVDHLCFNTSCVNPGHLEPVTRAENQRRRDARQRELRNAMRG